MISCGGRFSGQSRRAGRTRKKGPGRTSHAISFLLDELVMLFSRT